ncbi:MAG: 4-hydroxythreonine-4-phosphate dehydrogenase PdxA, partial [Candidatus Saccharibacteria bacterium]|nr:4-hydroxythreonine-4-phosphate dehydrogenase PdxA [Rhodoferax sp.]
MKKPMAITLGDPAGIGPEIIAKSFRDAPEEMRGCFVVGDVATMRRASELISPGHTRLPVASLETPLEALGAPPHCLPVLQVGAPKPLAAFGVISADAGKLAAECVVWAAKAALRGEISAIVTAPLHKEALALADEPHSCYPGHTEMLQALAAAHAGVPLADMPVRMMLANDEL